ncbi:protein jim lovell-like isoform X6 [Athalia rosae]|uniref:protein jim lovell-like isoform X6 n=1 Tax=Athalia rosae TaxID=37344 RepID=UPI00203324C1|nr:protein jim lovell-like isoform X6 [Athalia rosae]
MESLLALSLLRGGDLGPPGGMNVGLPMNNVNRIRGAEGLSNLKSMIQRYPANVKQRKVNFSVREVETLLAMVRQYRDAILMSVANGRGWLQAWQSVAKAVSAAEGVERSESDCRKKWTYLKWEARHTSKPGRTPTSRAVLDILLNKDYAAENRFAPMRPEHRSAVSAVDDEKSTGVPPNNCESSLSDGNNTTFTPIVWGGIPQPDTENLIPTVSQTNSAGKGIRIGQSLIRPRTIVPSSSLQSQQMQQHHQTHTQNQHHQQQQQQPKTLVLKAIPLKVKHVSPTTIKMARRQTSAEIPKNPAPAQQPTEVCLRWNSYHSNMQNSFPSLLDSEEFVDVTLACEGRSLKCHKMILSSCSDYLANLLRENPCQHPIILMKDLKFWEVEALVKFMYRGEVNVAHDKLPQLLNAAEALQVKGLAGPSPSSQNSKPPMLIPQPKPSTSQPAISRLTTEAKDSKHHFTGAANVATPPKRSQKRQLSESNENHKPFTKIRLQRPASPVSPVVTVKLEPLDIPLSPTEMFADERDNPSSSSTRYGNLPNDFRGEEGSEGTREVSSTEREINFCEIPGPPDLNDSEEQMEFVPTDFLEQEQDILDEQDGDHEGEDCEDIDDDDIGEELNESNDKDDMPGRRSGDDRDEVDDEENDCEYSEKLSDENNTT